MSHFPYLQFAAMEKLASSPDGMTARDFTYLFPGSTTEHGRCSRAAELVHALRCKGHVRESGRRVPEGARCAVRVWVITDEGQAWLEAAQARTGGAG
jgi:hypothetical protein